MEKIQFSHSIKILSIMNYSKQNIKKGENWNFEMIIKKNNNQCFLFSFPRVLAPYHGWI